MEHGTWRKTGGADRDRTGDPLLAKQVLSQLSYSPSPAITRPSQTTKRQAILREPGVESRRALKVGGSGWTRTIDPALIKRVL